MVSMERETVELNKSPLPVKIQELEAGRAFLSCGRSITASIDKALAERRRWMPLPKTEPDRATLIRAVEAGECRLLPFDPPIPLPKGLDL